MYDESKYSELTTAGARTYKGSVPAFFEKYMSLFDNIKSFLGVKSKWYEGGSLGSFLGVGSALGRDMQYNKGWVYAAVHAISEAMANIDFVLYEKQSNGTVTELTEHPLLDLLDGVNPTMTGYELKHRTGSHLELSGNAFWLLMGKNGQPVRDMFEQPVAIYPLNPANVKFERGDFPELVKSYSYQNKANSYIYQPFQILHLKYPNPSDDVLGLAPVEALKSWIETEQAASDFQRMYFVQGSRIGGILKSSKTLTIETIQMLRAQWHEMTQGLRNAHKPIIMPDYLTFEDTTQTTQEMDFNNSTDNLRDKILAGLRVPKTMLGNAEAATNRATADTATYVFALYTIKPKMKLITAYLNEFLVPRFGDNLFLGFKDPVPENRDIELQELGAAMGGQAIMTLDEARAKYLGLGPVEGGNQIFGPVMNVPIATGQEAQTIENTAPESRVKVATSGKPFRTQSARNAKQRADFAKTLAAAGVAAVMGTVKTKGIAELTDEEYEKIWKQKIVRLQPYEKKIAGLLGKVNEKTKKEVKKNLASAVKAIAPIYVGQVKAVAAGDLVKDNDKYVSMIVDGAVPVQLALYDQESQEASALIGIDDVDLMTPAVKTAVEKSVEKMAKSYTGTTLDLLTTKLNEGIADGLGINDLTDVIDGVFDYSDLTRAESVARTETTRIGNDAKVEAWKQSGIVGTKIWYTAEDERVCPYCDAMNGTEIDLDANFFEEGDTLTGTGGEEMTVDYSAMGGPPAHVNCRCDMRPGDIQS